MNNYEEISFADIKYVGGEIYDEIVRYVENNNDRKENFDMLDTDPAAGPGTNEQSSRRITFGPTGIQDSIGAWIASGMAPLPAAEQHCLTVMLQIKRTYRNFKWYDKRNPKAVGYSKFSMDLRTIFRDVCKNSSILMEADEPYDFASMPIEDSVKGPRPIAPSRLYYAAIILEKLYDAQGRYAPRRYDLDESHNLLLQGASACKTLGQMYYAYYFAAKEERTPSENYYKTLFVGREMGYVEREYETDAERERHADSSM